MCDPMRERTSLAWVLAALAAIGCGGSGGSNGSTGSGVEIATTPLSGKIGGQDWTFGSADTDAFLSDASAFFVTFYGKTVLGEIPPTCAAFSSSNGNEVIMNIPNAPGDYDVTLTMNATLYDADTARNMVATRGRLVVDSVSPFITGGLHVIYGNDGNNEVNGRFDITICPAR